MEWTLLVSKSELVSVAQKIRVAANSVANLERTLASQLGLPAGEPICIYHENQGTAKRVIDMEDLPLLAKVSVRTAPAALRLAVHNGSDTSALVFHLTVGAASVGELRSNIESELRLVDGLPTGLTLTAWPLSTSVVELDQLQPDADGICHVGLQELEQSQGNGPEGVDNVAPPPTPPPFSHSLFAPGSESRALRFAWFSRESPRPQARRGPALVAE